MGEGFWVMAWLRFGVGLQLVGEHFWRDDAGRNWWPIPLQGMTDEELDAYAIKSLRLPWLDEPPVPPDWEGGPPSPEVGGWKVIRA